jgi:hypothetical protein
MILKFLEKSPTYLLAVILVLVLGGTLGALEFLIENDDIGIWVFTVLALIEIPLILGPKMSLLMGGRAKFLIVYAVMVAMGAGMFLYLLWSIDQMPTS